jgi:hypothetical protein
MFVKTLTFQGQTRSFIVDSFAASGWEVRIEHDSTTVRRSHYSDWHRLERAVSAIEREMRELEARGWQVTRASGAAPVTR